MRIDYPTVNADLFSKVMALQEAVASVGLDEKLANLVRVRVSQLNECLFCLDMHIKEAVISGVEQLKIHHISLWEESSLFSDKEKMALCWAESLTQINHADNEDLFEEMKEFFSENEIVELTYVVSMMNFWNRLGVAFKAEPGTLDALYGLDKAGL